MHTPSFTDSHTPARKRRRLAKRSIDARSRKRGLAFEPLEPRRLLSLSTTRVSDYFVQGFDLGDVDNDHVKDLVVSSPSTKQVVVYDAQDHEKYRVSFSEVPRAILVADLDADGRNELVVGTSGTNDQNDAGHIYVGEVGPGGQFTNEWTSPSYWFRLGTQLAAGDLNANGTNELILGGSYWDRKLVSYEYQGGAYSKIFEDPIGSDVSSVAVSGDLLLV
jgi:hypothetical protein